ncbi:unnamed protein product [Clonostachys solani]|uniref:Uncharacterized protein n=1 Tax=Clonostachys solani TaxID=160281 RepID=A0A9N9W5K6_9HYPO|nr:unnamed protein product [Clonostachys solani]
MAFEDNDRLQLTARLDEFVNRARTVIASETPTETYQSQCRSLESRMQQEIGRIRELSTSLDIQQQTDKMMQFGMEKARLAQEHKDTFPAKQQAWLHKTASTLAGFSKQYQSSLSTSEISSQARGSLEDTAVDPQSMVSPSPERSQGPVTASTHHSEAEEVQTNAAPLESTRPRRASTQNKRRFSETPWCAPVPRTVTTIPFEDVYQDGKAEIKYTIIECEHSLTTDASVKGRWWILRCEQHDRHFAFAKGGIRSGPTKHLLKHTDCSPGCKTNRNIDVFGVLVLECTAELAKRNNEDVEAAFANGYDPKSVADPGLVTLRKRRKANSGNGAVPGSHPILDPEFGKLYMSCWRGQMYAVVLLPLRELSTLIPPVAMDESMKTPPKCYNYDKVTKLLSRWAPGFEDGGPKVRQRAFPCRFFDHNDIEQCRFAFLKATTLYELDMSSVPSQHHAVVQEYKEKFLERDTHYNTSEYSNGIEDANHPQTPNQTDDAAAAEQLRSEIPSSDPRDQAPSTDMVPRGQRANGSNPRKSRTRKRNSRLSLDDDSIQSYTTYNKPGPKQNAY